MLFQSIVNNVPHRFCLSYARRTISARIFCLSCFTFALCYATVNDCLPLERKVIRTTISYTWFLFRCRMKHLGLCPTDELAVEAEVNDVARVSGDDCGEWIPIPASRKSSRSGVEYRLEDGPCCCSFLRWRERREGVREGGREGKDCGEPNIGRVGLLEAWGNSRSTPWDYPFVKNTKGRLSTRIATIRLLDRYTDQVRHHNAYDPKYGTRRCILHGKSVSIASRRRKRK